MVLARSPEQEQAIQDLLAAQQNPSSPEYHHWLTPEEVGERFGLSDQDLAAVTSWLQSQNLHVNWVSPSRIFIQFGGAAADLGRAFQTDFQYYSVNGEQRYSVSSDPMVPAALAPAIKAIHGLYTIKLHPHYHVATVSSSTPQMTYGANHYVAPADFATIYDLPTNLTGAGVTIGIVGEGRTDFSDYNNLRALTGSTFANPTEVVPTAFGGIDPGPAYTTAQTGSVDVGNQMEAEEDVQRAGTVAPGARLLLVISADPSSGGYDIFGDNGIDFDLQYLIQTSPVPAQIISMSWGDCELNEGLAGVQYYDTLFQQAALEGISAFIASGDSGASGCDPHAESGDLPPPANPLPNSTTAECATSYATCMGGTEFNDTGNPSLYWSSTNGSNLASALSYIPEGAWNDPLDYTSGNPNVSAGGGGVSIYMPTPGWQIGTGVPAARAGRYTPDLSFSASGDHDGDYGCLEAFEGAGCPPTSTANILWGGTSATAPDMAGVTALLDQKLGGAQGNINPELYAMAANVPSAFHDVTVASSGVPNCSVNTPSMCNNSLPGPTGLTGGQAGFLVTPGYDLATGLGSLDVQTFINNFATTFSTGPWTTTDAASAVTANTATLAGSVNPRGADTHAWFLYGTSSTLSGATQTASQDLGSGSAPAALSANISGLSAGGTYYFQAVAQSSSGLSTGAIISFSTAAPVVTTTSSSAITSNSATVSGTVNPNGADTHTWFLYGTSSTLSGASQTASQDIGSGSMSIPVSANITGLNPGVTYYYQAVAQNSSGTNKGAIDSFVAAASAPSVTASSASAITANSATVTTTVNPNGANTGVAVMYGTSSTLSTYSETNGQNINGTTAVQLTFNLTGLAAHTTYYFQVGAQNSVGAITGTIGSFTTAVPAPTVTIGSPSAITASTATLAATVNPNGADTHAWFLYGTSSTLSGASQTTSQDLGSGTSTTPLSANLSGLTAGTTYYFQAVAQNSSGTTNGTINNFTTLGPANVTTGSASSITGTTATLGCTVNPNGADTQVWFLYGTNSTLSGASQTTSFDVGSGTSVTQDTLNLYGLRAGTTYYFQAVAQNSYGTTSGSINSFSTTSNKTTPTITWSTPAAITYGTALSATQLDATASVAGSFSYTPPLGTVLSAGSQTITVSFTPTDTTDYNTASGSVTLTVNKATPTITWSTPAAVPVGTALSSTQLNATASVPGTFLYSPASGTVMSTTGSITLSTTFTPTDTTDYNSTSSTVLLTVSPLPAPTITFTVPNHTYGDAPFTVSATSNSSGAITYSVVSGPATISGSTVMLTGAGTVVLQASQAASSNYSAGTQTATFTVAGQAPTITFTVPNHTYGDAPFTVSASSNSTGAITYSVVSGPTTISGSTVTLTGAGTVVLQASQAAAGNYAAGTQTATFTVATESQTITFTAPTSPVTYGVSPITLSATSTSGLTVTFSVVSGPGTVSGSTLTITGVGTVVVAANQAGNTNYAAAAQVTQSIVVNVIGVAATPAFSPVAGTYTVAQTVSISDTTAGATIYYTTNGTTPTTSSTVYGSTITVSSTETLEAIATATGYSTSAVATGAYTISIPTNPVPAINGISPAYTNAGGAVFTLTVNGSEFIAGSTVYWGASALTTTYVSATQLTAQVPAADTATAGTNAITVQNPAPGGGTSNVWQFEVDSASSGSTAPTITSTTETVAAGSTASYPVTMPSAVTSVSVSCLNLPTGASCSYSSTTNTVTIATSSTTPKGTYQITVVFTETVTSAAFLLPILLLPLGFMRRKLTARGIWFTACLGLVLLATSTLCIGCGSGGGGGSGSSTPPATQQVTSSGSVSLTIQ
jgi:hypothetical protein